MTALLEVLGLHAGYGQINVLQGIDIRVEAGSVLAIIGSNGAGKTTLMRTISGLLPPSAGRVTFEGRDITALPTSKRVDLGIALVPEGRLVFPDFTVEETLRIGAFTRRARDGRQARSQSMLELFPQLKARWTTRAGVLSGGEQQMLAIARGLMSAPRLLLLDEPSLGLAPAMAAQIFDLIDQIRQTGVTVCLVEQDVRRTLELADRAVVLENGLVAVTGEAKELLQSDQVKESYLGL
jgi:branched-chain amino acid transport system ATP-binding protein